MIQIYFSFIETPLPPVIFNKYVNEMPEEIAERIGRFRRWEDATLCLMGKLLLLRGLKMFNVTKSLNDLTYSSYQRPYFENENIDFNISHSGNCVVCAISEQGRIGVDIELIKREIEINDFKQQFQDQEWQDVLHSTQKLNTFYEYWTKKESGIKADGRGLSVPLDKVIVVDNQVYVEEKGYFLSELQIDLSYKAYLAAEHLTGIPKITKVDIQDEIAN